LQCDALASEGAQVAASPAELAQRCDIVYGMLADPAAAAAVVFGEGGLLGGLCPGKG
jgi:3-hydroxyisobutyrate dehydrogenase-like beta-hydroxyacid dehydrogenase